MQELHKVLNMTECDRLMPYGRVPNMPVRGFTGF